MNLKNMIQQVKINIMDPDKPYWILSTILLMAIILLISNHSKNSQATLPDTNNSISNVSNNIDTFVPNGFVLVTLQLINGDSIDPLIGNYGMVDVYQSPQIHLSSPDSLLSNNIHNQNLNSNLPIATHLRIIRAPNNPRLFGALVPEGSRKLIQLLSAPVFAVIQRPDAQSTTNIEKKSQSQPIQRIIKIGDIL